MGPGRVQQGPGPMTILTHEFTILGGTLSFLILKTPNIAHESIILGGPLIFLVFVPKSNGTTKLI